MKIYVASSFQNKKTVSSWMEKLRNIGFDVTFDWTNQEAPPRGELTLSLPEQRVLANHDMMGVRSAEIVWVISPTEGGCGCWFELGAAYALCKRIIVSGPRRTIFMALTSISYFEDHEQAFQFIKDFQYIKG